MSKMDKSRIGNISDLFSHIVINTNENRQVNSSNMCESKSWGWGETKYNSFLHFNPLVVFKFLNHVHMTM